MRHGGFFGLALAALVASEAQAAEPYPHSTMIPAIQWYADTYKFSGLGGDIWQTTVGPDAKVYTAWGDGKLSCASYVSYGVATISGGPSANLRTIGCGTPGENHGKIVSLAFVDNKLLAIGSLQDKPWPKPTYAIWSSQNEGRTWQKLLSKERFTGTGRMLRPSSFVQLRGGNQSAGDGYVYLTAQIPSDPPGKDFYLLRAPRSSNLASPASYQYFHAVGVWTKNAKDAVPVFTDRNGVDGPNIVYDAGLRRYLLTTTHGHAGQIGVFESSTMWGPWGTIDYQEHWLGITGGEFLGISFPSRWMGRRGRSLWAVFSCYGTGSACANGKYHDRFNLMRARLVVKAAAHDS